MSAASSRHLRLAHWFRLPPRGTILAHFEDFLVPNEVLASGDLDDRASRARTLRVISVISGASVAAFVPSLVIAGVPTDVWLAYVAGALATVAVISWSLLLVRAGTRMVPVGGVAASLAIAGLALLIGEYFHQIALLFALVVASFATIYGFRPALVMVICGSLLVPATITVGPGFDGVDVMYAFIYLFGVATVPWIHLKLRSQGAELLRISATKYRGLVEHVPAIVYTAGSGSDGACDYVSPRVEELLGFPARAWTDDPGFWVSRVHPDDRTRMMEHWTRDPARSTRSSNAIEYRMIDHEGRIRWVRDEASMFDAGTGPSRRWTGFLTDITDRKELEDQLQHQAFHDPLTGLPNRALFADRLGHALARAGRRRGSLAVLFLDLDDFKTVNDGIGHEAGDELLVAVARVLEQNLRQMDTAARLGGDEFAILLEDLTEVDAAVEAAERIRAAVSRPVSIQGREIVVDVSIGIASPSTPDDGVAEIMRDADAAMYSAKRQGKGRHATFMPAMHEAVVERLELSGDMRRAIELSEFEVYYQPVVHLDDASIRGFEALVRWDHPRRGLVMPEDFIGAAEESGQIIDIGRRVLEEACLQARAWHDTYGDADLHHVSVNVSARQFRDPRLGDYVTEALERAGLEASALTLEITESTIMEDSDAALRRLKQLKRLGIRLAIDDFGTGYSSLSYLRRLPVDTLKVDKSFVDEIVAGGQAFELARMIVSIGQTYRLATVAEGVEKRSQVTALRRMGCEVAQGFHFAHPMRARDIGTLLTTREHAAGPGGSMRLLGGGPDGRLEDDGPMPQPSRGRGSRAQDRRGSNLRV